MDIEELIQRRRRQIMLHSFLYYELDQTLIDDATFDKWAHELASLQTKCPEHSARVAYEREAFADFDGSTGFDLPYKQDNRLASLALGLISYRKRV